MRNKISLYIYSYLQIFYILYGLQVLADKVFIDYTHIRQISGKREKMHFKFSTNTGNVGSVTLYFNSLISTIILPVHNGRLYKTPIVTVIHKLLKFSLKQILAQ